MAALITAVALSLLAIVLLAIPLLPMLPEGLRALKGWWREVCAAWRS